MHRPLLGEVIFGLGETHPALLLSEGRHKLIMWLEPIIQIGNWVRALGASGSADGMKETPGTFLAQCGSFTPLLLGDTSRAGPVCSRGEDRRSVLPTRQPNRQERMGMGEGWGLHSSRWARGLMCARLSRVTIDILSPVDGNKGHPWFQEERVSISTSWPST